MRIACTSAAIWYVLTCRRFYKKLAALTASPPLCRASLRGRGPSALPQSGLQIGRALVLVQQIAELVQEIAERALAALNSPNETDRKTRARKPGSARASGGNRDGTDSRRVCRCRFVVDACLVRSRCVGMPRGRTRLQRICPRLRHRRCQAFCFAAMRAPQSAAGLHTRVVPARWFAHHLDRTRNGHAPAGKPQR